MGIYVATLLVIIIILYVQVLCPLERKEAAMPHSNGIITAPIGVDSDIPQVLGLSSTDIGYLCSNEHGKINIWSRKKPVRYNKLTELTDNEYKSVSFGLTYEVGGANDYGVWSYLPPRGEEEPYRSTDFNGYSHYMETGLCLKNKPSVISKDLFNDKTDLVLLLEDNPNMITCYDFKDTLLKNWNIRLFITSSDGSGKYFVIDIPVDKQSLKFTVPFINLTTNLGGGIYSWILYIASKSGGTFQGFFPQKYYRGTLKLTSNTGISVTNILSSYIIDNGVRYHLSDYYAGSGSRILDLTNQDFRFDVLNMDNKSSYVIGSNNMFFQFRWPGSNKQYYVYAPVLISIYFRDWTLKAGISMTDTYGTDSIRIAKMTNTIDEVQYVTFNIVYKHIDGYYHNVTDYMTIRMKKRTGPEPDYIPN